MKKIILTFLVLILISSFLVHQVLAGYAPSGTLVSKNLLAGKTVARIESFWYDASSLPSGTSLKVRFSQDKTNWYNSSGVLNGWNDCSQGSHTVNLSSLDWSGPNFYYQMEFNSNLARDTTPVLDEIKVNYSSQIIYPLWFQTQGGDVHGNDEVNSPIPPTCVAPCRPYLSLAQDGFNGVVSSGDTIFPGNGFIGELKNWYVEDEETIDFSDYDYQYFAKLLENETLQKPPDIADVNAIKSGFYQFISSQTFDTSKFKSNPVSTTIVVLVDGDLEIRKDIKVANGGFLAFLVSGDILVDEDVVDLQGVYIASDELKLTGENDTPLNAKGIFIGLDGVLIEREFEDEILNNTTPVATFVYRPDLFINAPDVLRQPRYTWEEVAP